MTKKHSGGYKNVLNKSFDGPRTARSGNKLAKARQWKKSSIIFAYNSRLFLLVDYSVWSLISYVGLCMGYLPEINVVD